MRLWFLDFTLIPVLIMCAVFIHLETGIPYLAIPGAIAIMFESIFQ